MLSLDNSDLEAFPGLYKSSYWFTDLCNIVIMVPPLSQRGIGSFFRKEDDLNDEEWEDYTDWLYDQSEELNKAILASRTAAREALEAPKPVKPARPAASSLELAAKVAHKNALSAKGSKKV